MRLPVIVSMGGVNAAGRTSGFQSFRRMVIDLLPEAEQQQTLVALAVMMNLVKPSQLLKLAPTSLPKTTTQKWCTNVQRIFLPTVMSCMKVFVTSFSVCAQRPWICLA